MASMSSRNNRLILIAIPALSVLLRAGVALYMGDSTPPGKDETSYSHYSVLKTISEAWGLPQLGHAADAETNLIAAPWK